MLFGHHLVGVLSVVEARHADSLACNLQVVMAVFAYLYYNNYVARELLAVGAVLNDAMQLDSYQQLELFSKLANVLAGADLIPSSMSNEAGSLLASRSVCSSTQ